MLAKKKNSKRVAMATVTASKKKSTRDQASGNAAVVPSSSSSKGYFMRDSRAELTQAHALDHATSGDPSGDLLRALGDHLNTRLQEISPDDDLDDDLFEEKRRQLMEEARLAAGTQQRVVSKAIAAYFATRPPPRAAAENENEKAKKEKEKGAPPLQLVRVHHNCNAITAVAMLGDERVVLGDKSGKVYIADLVARPGTLEEEEEEEAKGRGQARQDHKHLLEPTLAAGVVSLAVSDTRQNRPTTRDLYEKTTTDMSCTSYTAAGAEDGSISVWETESRKHKGLLFMHRKAVTGLSFRMMTAELYSSSDDGTLRVWNVPQMTSVDVLFGHEGKVYSLHGLRRETCATVGSDLTMRFWRTDAATQQSYQYLIQHRDATSGEDAAKSAQQKANSVPISLEAAAMLNERLVLVGATDGSLVLFDVNRRRPLTVVPAAHGYDSLVDGTGIEKTMQNLETANGAATARRIPNPISAVATVPYADVVASASYDGVVRLWHVLNAADSAPADPAAGQANTAKQTNSTRLVCIGELPIRALVTSLQFSVDGDVMCIACSKESRRGRWFVQKSALNSVCVVPLTLKGEKNVTHAMAHAIEHVPARLYHFEEENAASEGNSDNNDVSSSIEGAHDRKNSALLDRGEGIPETQDDNETPSEWDENEEADTFFKVGEDGQFVLSRREEPTYPSVDLKEGGSKKKKTKTGDKLTAKKAKSSVAKKTKKGIKKAPLLQHPTKKLKKMRKMK